MSLALEGRIDLGLDRETLRARLRTLLLRRHVAQDDREERYSFD